MASGRRSVKREMNKMNNRPTAMELTDAKFKVETIESNTVSDKTPDKVSSSSENESTVDVQEYINKLEGDNQTLKEELTKLQRLTTSRPNSLLTVIFPSTQHSIILKEELNGIIQEFCNRKRDEINAKQDTHTSTQSNDQAMSSVEFNDLFSLERYPDAPKAVPTSSAKLPKYSQVYSRIVEPKSNKPQTTQENIVQPALKLDFFTRPTRSCFNCGGDHIVSDCKEVKDFNKIRANKQEFLNSQGSEQQDRYSNSDHDRPSSGTRPYHGRDDHHRYSTSPVRRDIERDRYRRDSSDRDRLNRNDSYNPYYSRENSRDRDGRSHHYPRYQPSYHNDKDSRNSYQGGRIDRDVHMRMSSTPNRGTSRDIRMVDYHGSKLEYSSTYGDMELSDQELEDGEIINLNPRQQFHVPPPLPPMYPPCFSPPPPPPLPRPNSFHAHPIYFSRESRDPFPPPHKPYNALSRSMPDFCVGTKRRTTQRISDTQYSRETYSESSDGVSVFKTNKHNFSLDFPPGIVTPESMRPPERFNNIRRIIDRHK